MSYTKTLGLSEKLSGGELSAGQLGLLYSPCCLACCFASGCLASTLYNPWPEHCPLFSCSGSAAAQHSVVGTHCCTAAVQVAESSLGMQQQCLLLGGGRQGGGRGRP